MPTQPFNETEPNNTFEQADDLGKLSPDQVIHIVGHLDATNDPIDYFKFVSTGAGTVEYEVHYADNTTAGGGMIEGTYNAEQGEQVAYQHFAVEGSSANYVSDYDV